jgi:hypothetical protein
MSGDSELFACDVCDRLQPLVQGCLAELDCACVVCSHCASEHIRPLLKPHVPQRPAQPDSTRGDPFALGEAVSYDNRRTNTVDAAVVVQIDRSIQPPQ